jgi:DNA (cytosine-5)-methyltransferase 1
LLTQKVEDEFYISKEERKKWEALKNAKSEERTNSAGIVYFYTEGGMPFPDPLDKPARTIITGEGGRSPSRFKHAVQSKTGLRRLTPVELERLNMFPDNHTLHEGVSNTKRAFFMGNALVVGVVERIGITLKSFL